MEKPTRCIDPVIKYCQECKYGHCIYPDWVETREDLEWCTFETCCIYGFDQGRPEDEPTEEELAEFESWLEETRKMQKELIEKDNEDWDMNVLCVVMEI